MDVQVFQIGHQGLALRCHLGGDNDVSALCERDLGEGANIRPMMVHLLKARLLIRYFILCYGSTSHIDI